MKHAYIHIIDGEIEVRSPAAMPPSEIRGMLLRKLDWIRKHQARYREQPAGIDPRKVFLLEGREIPVRYLPLPSAARKISLEWDGKEAIVHADPEMIGQENLRRLYDEAYRIHCKKTFPEIVEVWSRRMGLFPSRLSFRRARTRWGSCSSRDSISLNLRLAMLPPELAEYVIVHELAHIRHKNHSRDFWSLVEKYLKDYQARRAALREYERYL